MPSWYQVFFASVIVLWATSTPKDRPALRVILLATVGSFLLTEFYTRQIHAAWKLIFPGMVETLTILCLIRFAPNRTGYIQAGLLVIAWLAHFLCYVDILIGSDFVYSHYEGILATVGAGQLVACHDIIRANLERVGRLLASLWPSRAGHIRAARASASVLRGPIASSLQPIYPPWPKT